MTFIGSDHNLVENNQLQIKSDTLPQSLFSVLFILPSLFLCYV